MAITHQFVSAKDDGLDDTVVRPSDWNAAHEGTWPADDVVVTPAGGIEATDVQAAIEELDDEKAGIADTETITGAWTFDLDPAAPFAVSASSAVVPNLDADLLDGQEAAEFAGLADTETITGAWTFDQASGTGARPVMILDQADVSEEFIKLIGTSATGVLTQSLVLATDVETATLAGYAKVYVQDDGEQLTDQGYFIPIYTLAGAE